MEKNVFQYVQRIKVFITNAKQQNPISNKNAVQNRQHLSIFQTKGTNVWTNVITMVKITNGAIRDLITLVINGINVLQHEKLL